MLTSCVLLGFSSTASAQNRVAVTVVDQSGAPVPFAYVSLVGRTPRTADDSGRVSFDARRLDSLRFSVRRLGYHPLDTAAGANGSGAVRLQMRTIPRSLGAVTVTARPDDVLTNRGYYDRMMRVRRGAFTADFIGPEELAARNPMSVSRALLGSRYASIRNLGRRVQITGRGGCAMTILIDGQAVQHSTQDINGADPTSIVPAGTRQSREQDPQQLLDINDLVSGADVLAIEIYPSVANAPVELQRVTARGSCGLVAIWTGGRPSR